jgi:hypothetical protein
MLYCVVYIVSDASYTLRSLVLYSRSLESDVCQMSLESQEAVSNTINGQVPLLNFQAKQVLSGIHVFVTQYLSKTINNCALVESSSGHHRLRPLIQDYPNNSGLFLSQVQL